MALAKPNRIRLAPAERRRLILDATIAALAEHGPQGCTLRQVARDMGVAPSLITYFFSTWPDLLRQAYLALIAAYDADIGALKLGTSKDPEAEMAGFLEAAFADRWTRDPIAGAHVSLWALARGDVDLNAEMAQSTARFRDHTRGLIARLIEHRGGGASPQAVNAAFYALTSGLWFEMTVNPGTITRAEATETVWAFLDTAIPPTAGDSE